MAEKPSSKGKQEEITETESPSPAPQGLAETYRDKALLDNGYAADGYVHDMEQETLYAQARARLAQGEKS